MALSRSRPGSSSSVVRTSSRSCLIIDPTRMTLAGSVTNSVSGSSPSPPGPVPSLAERIGRGDAIGVEQLGHGRRNRSWAHPSPVDLAGVRQPGPQA